MKSWIKYLGYVVFFVLGWMMSSQCNRQSCPPCPQVVSHSIDTVYSHSVDTVFLTVERKVPYVKHVELLKIDTVRIGLASVRTAQHQRFVNYHLDSAYTVETNVLYNGELIGVDQMFTKNKDDLMVIQRTDTVRIREEIKLEMPPRRILSAGPLAQGDRSGIIGAGAAISYMDRKQRSLDVGYLAYANVWQASVKIPIWSR
jgi:hypothetical protein